MSACIVLATDQNYVRQTCVTIASYALSNPTNRSEIQVLIHGLDGPGVRLLETTAAAFGLSLGMIPIDLEWTSRLPESFRSGLVHVSPMTYSKLIAMEYIPSHYRRCLMLDTDLLVIDSLDDLICKDLSTFPVAAVQDFMMPKASGLRLGLKNPESYFNCGVLLMDRNNWNKCAPLSKISSVVEAKSEKICYGDQDIMNVIFDGNYLPLNYKYNHMHMVSLDGLIPNHRLQGTPPAILHFPGQIKPWHEYAPRNLQAAYFRYASACQWIGMKLMEPASLQETKIAARLSEKMQNKSLYEKYIAKLN
jgi:lipopolysaccharide biosynthesis glycosyltransferase